MGRFHCGKNTENLKANAFYPFRKTIQLVVKLCVCGNSSCTWLWLSRYQEWFHPGPMSM